MSWVVIASAVGGVLIGGFYFRAVVVIMTSVQIALFHAALYFAGESSGLQCLGYGFASLTAHQIAYFLSFSARLYAMGDIDSPDLVQQGATRGINPALGERFDEAAVLASEIERRAPQVRREAAHVGRLIREIRAALEERRAAFR